MPAAEDQRKLVTEKWKSMQLFKRHSNLAVAQHESVRNLLLNKYPGDTEETQEEKKLDAQLEECFGKNGTLLQDKGTIWLYENEEKLLDALQHDSRYQTLLDYAKTEHRRWCYFMASCGWKSIDSDEYDKRSSLKASSCMCTWEKLAGGKPSKYATCKYDLMPLLMRYTKNKRK